MALVLLLFAANLFAQSSPEAATHGREVLDALLSGKYEPVYALWTPEMQKGMPYEVYRGQMLQLKTLGKPQSIGEAATRTIDDLTVVTIPVRWSAMTLNFRVTWTKDWKIAGTWFLNPQAGAITGWLPPPYSKPGSFSERDVTVGDGEWKLPGTLTVPAGKGPFPALVLVHGSGPQDRDETIFGNKVFKDFAEGLASRGIAVLRYDKRTKVHPGKLISLKDFTLRQETVEDAVKAAGLLRTQPGIDPARVFVLGHSLGGYAGPRIAKQDGKLLGLVVLAGNVRPVEDLIIEQNLYFASLKGGLSKEEEKQFEQVKEQVERIKKLEAGKDNPAALLGMPVSYLLDLKGYDPAAEAKKLSVRMLILQGERDFQVGMKDFALWKSALGERKDVVFRSYPKLNHLFIAGEGKGTIAEYEKPGHVAPEVIDDIAKWIAPAK